MTANKPAGWCRGRVTGPWYGVCMSGDNPVRTNPARLFDLRRRRAGVVRVEAVVLLVVVASFGLTGVSSLGRSMGRAIATVDESYAPLFRGVVVSSEAGLVRGAAVAVADGERLVGHVLDVTGQRMEAVTRQRIGELHPAVVRRANAWFEGPLTLASGEGGSKRGFADALLGADWRAVDAYAGSTIPQRHAFEGMDVATAVRRTSELVDAHRARLGDAEFQTPSRGLRVLNDPGIRFLHDTVRVRATRFGELRAFWPAKVNEIDEAISRLESLAVRVEAVRRADAVSRAKLLELYADAGAILAPGGDVAVDWAAALRSTRKGIGLIIPSTGWSRVEPSVRWATRNASHGYVEVPFGYFGETTERALKDVTRAQEVLQEMFTDNVAGMARQRELHLVHGLTGRYLEAWHGRALATDPDLARAIERSVGRLGPEGVDEGFGTVQERLAGRAWKQDRGPLATADAARVATLFEGDANLRFLADVALPKAPASVKESLIAPWLAAGDAAWSGPFVVATYQQLAHRPWLGALDALHRRTRAGTPSLSLEELPPVLLRADALFDIAQRISASAPRTVRLAGIREVASSTLGYMRDQLARRVTEMDEVARLYAGDTDGIDVIRRRIAVAEEAIDRALDRRALSFEDIEQVVDGYMVASGNHPFLDETHLPTRRPERWFPYLTDSDEFWDYRQVWRWRHSRTLPAELPSSAKGTYASPYAFMEHEFGHLTLVERNTQRTLSEWLVARFDQLAVRNPGAAADLTLFLGNFRWEQGIGQAFESFLRKTGAERVTSVRGLGELPLALPDGNIHFSSRASRTLAAWGREWAAASEGTKAP